MVLGMETVEDPTEVAVVSPIVGASSVSLDSGAEVAGEDSAGAVVTPP